MTGLRLPYLWYCARRLPVIGRMLRAVGMPRTAAGPADKEASRADARRHFAADGSSAAAPQALSAEYLDGVMALNDAAFIDAAYHAILGREPDHGGRIAHMTRLCSGVARIDIVRSFEQSPEGRAAAAAGRCQTDWRRVAEVCALAGRLPARLRDAPQEQLPGAHDSVSPADQHCAGDSHAANSLRLQRLTAQWPRGVRRNG